MFEEKPFETRRKLFSCIVADPPFGFDGVIDMTDTPRGAAANYPTMDMEAIKNLDVASLADPKGCLLALWVPSSMLFDGLDIMKSWGFRQTQTYIWAKIKKDTSDFPNVLTFGLGRIFRQSHEICLIGINNTGLYKKIANKSQRSLSFGENIKHSSKPEHLQDSIDLMFPEHAKIELFARRQRPGWICVGNQAPETEGEDIRDSLARLKEFHEENASP
jgi:N6-adenosine-specific RNA methylase IME4